MKRTFPAALRERMADEGNADPIRFYVFANDCGLRNYGYCITDVTAQRDPATGDWRYAFAPIEHGINRAVIDNVKDPEVLQAQQLAYLRWVAEKVRQAPEGVPVVFAAERYMARRGQGSLTVELVGFMLGTASMLMSRLQHDDSSMPFAYDGGVPVLFYPAALWKNAFARRYGSPELLDRVYETVKDRWGKGVALTDHQVDAYLQSVWAAHQMLGLSGFEHLSRTFLQDLVSTAPADQADVKPSKAPPTQRALVKKRKQERAAAKRAKLREKAKAQKAKQQAARKSNGQ